MYRLLIPVLIFVSLFSCQPEKADKSPVTEKPVTPVDTAALRKRKLAEEYLKKYCSFSGASNEMSSYYFKQMDVNVDEDSTTERMILAGCGDSWESYFLILKEEGGQWKLWYKDSVDNHYGDATFRVISTAPFRVELIHDKTGGTGFYFIRHEIFQVQGDKMIPVLTLQESANTNAVLNPEIQFTVSAGKNKNELQVKAKYYYYMCATLYQEEGMSDSITWAYARMNCDQQAEIIILKDSIEVTYRFNNVKQIYEPASHTVQLKFIQHEALREDYWLSQFVSVFGKALQDYKQRASTESQKNINWILQHARNIK